jgi:hypothetical protein
VIPTLEEIHNRGWRMKSWTTRRGQHHAGRGFDRHALVRLLSSVVSVGEVKYQGKIYAGEQPAIVDRKVWNRAAARRWWPDTRPSRVAGILTMFAGRRRNGARAPVPAGLVAGWRMEGSVVKALYQVARQPGREPLQQALPVDATVWEALERGEQHRILATVVERIPYDRGLQQGRLY